MNNPNRMQIDSGFNYLTDYESRQILAKFLSLVHILIKIFSIDILSDDVNVRFAPDGLFVFDDLWV